MFAIRRGVRDSIGGLVPEHRRAGPLSFGTKMLFSFGAMLLVTLTVGGLGLYSVDQLGDRVRRVIDLDARKATLAANVDSLLSDQAGQQRGVAIRAVMKDPAGAERYAQELRSSRQEIEQRLRELEPLVYTPRGRLLLDDLRTALAPLPALQEQLYALAAAGAIEPLLDFQRQQLLPLTLRAKQSAEKLMQFQTELMAAARREAEGAIRLSHWLTLGAIALALLLGCVLMHLVRVTSRQLHHVAAQLAVNAGESASTAGQISAASHSLAQGASEQAATLEETSAAAREMMSEAKQNDERSQQTSALVKSSQERFAAANQTLEATVLAMTEINAQGARISKIIKVIDGIAFQTNILALNAAVEAARAGEAGLGFAVVATEVGNLAQRCAQAARDTTSLIEESIEKARDGKIKVDQVAAALDALLAESSAVARLVDESSSGRQRESQNLARIVQAITQVDQLTQHTAAGAEQGASAATELNSQSESLRGVVNQLNQLVGTQAV